MVRPRQVHATEDELEFRVPQPATPRRVRELDHPGYQDGAQNAAVGEADHRRLRCRQSDRDLESLIAEAGLGKVSKSEASPDLSGAASMVTVQGRGGRGEGGAARRDGDGRRVILRRSNQRRRDGGHAQDGPPAPGP